MSKMEIELNNMHSTGEGSPMITQDESEQKGITVLDELLEQELKEDNSVDCFIKRVEDASEDSSEFSLNYDEPSHVSGPALFSPKEASADTSSSMDKELEDTLDKDKEVAALVSDADHLQSTETTQDIMPITSESVEETNEGTEEITYNEEGTVEITYNEEITEAITDHEEITKEITDDEESTKEITCNEEGTEVTLYEESTEEITCNEEGTEEITCNEEGTEEITCNEEGTEEITCNEEDAEEITCNEEGTEEITCNEEGTEEITCNEEGTEEITYSEESTKEIIYSEEDSKVITANGESIVLDKNDSDPIEDQAEENNTITKETDSIMEEVNKEDIVVEETIKDTDTTIVEDEVDKENNVLEVTTKEKEMPDTTELPNSNAGKSEKDADSGSAEPANGNVLYLVIRPKDQVDKVNDDAKENESKSVQCIEASMTSKTIPDKSVANKVIIVGSSSSESKNGIDINTPIIVKKITKRIIKSGSAVTTNPVSTCQVNNSANDQGNMNYTKPSESGEKQYDESNDSKGESSVKEHGEDAANVKTGEPKVILTKRRYASNKRTRKVPQEKHVPSIDDVEGMETNEIQILADHDKDLTLGIGPVENKKRVNTSKGRALRSQVSGKQDEGEVKSTSRKTVKFADVKRKFEEMCKVSQEEEDAAIEEIKKMKKETLGVLKKINAEMEKLAYIFGREVK